MDGDKEEHEARFRTVSLARWRGESERTTIEEIDVWNKETERMREDE